MINGINSNLSFKTELKFWDEVTPANRINVRRRMSYDKSKHYVMGGVPDNRDLGVYLFLEGIKAHRSSLDSESKIKYFEKFVETNTVRYYFTPLSKQMKLKIEVKIRENVDPKIKLENLLDLEALDEFILTGKIKEDKK